MRIKSALGLVLALAIIGSVEAADLSQPATPDPARQLREYRDFAMGHDGYGTTIVETKSDETFSGIIKQSSEW